MKTITVVTFLLLLTSNSYSQKGEKYFKVYGEFMMAAHQPEDKSSKGFGIGLKRERFLSEHFVGSLRLGYQYYKGKFTSWEGETSNSFSLVPLLIGGKYYFKKVYAGFETGIVIKASSNSSTRLAFVPSVGIVLNKLDLSVSLLGVPELSYGIPEKTYLQKGGYSYLGLQLGWRL